ncbi:MAG: hypothetical protein ACOYM3_06200 [Terrimicrobiaceae bacterium]
MKKFSIADFRLPIAESPHPARRAKLYASSFILHLFTSSAFSLVEVTLAIGVASFALIAVLGLLPVGLKSVKNANEQAAAANVLNAVACSLRTASSTNSLDFFNTFAGQAIQYSVGSGASTIIVSWNNLTLEGSTETSQSPKRLSAVLNFTPPGTLITTGRATVTVAWSAQANPTWNATTQQWTNADGAITSGLQFLPRP